MSGCLEFALGGVEARAPSLVGPGWIAHARPVGVERAFDANRTFRFALDGDGQLGRGGLVPVCDVLEVSPAASTQLAEERSFLDAELEEKSLEIEVHGTPFDTIRCRGVKHFLVSRRCSTQKMNDDALIRLENLKALNLTAQQLSARVGGRVSYWSDLMRGQKSFGEKAARNIEEKLGMPRGYMDSADPEAPVFVPAKAPEDAGDVMHALKVLADALAAQDKATRSAVAPLLSLLAQEPDQFENIASTLGKLLPGTNLARVPQDDESAGREITAVLPSLERKELQGHAKRISNQGRGRT